MSKLLTSVDPDILEAVLGGAGVTARCATTNNDLLNSLNGLSTTLQNIGNASKTSGFSTTDILMLGLFLNQQRQVNVFVRRPFW
jgi:hypothetical protein